MSLKLQVTGLNEFLTTIYNTETRLSLLLSNLGFDSQQIETLRRQHLEQVVTSFIAVVQERIISGSDGERLYKIISRRFSLDGEPPETLESLGEQFGVSRERIRQLEKKAIRRCRHKARLQFWEASLCDIAQRALS
jgi:DNA-directed RNA polymerase sigma subunit (sigma70/sigma32)